MTELEIAWLAGWLEGEGCFRLAVGITPTIQLVTTDLDIAEKAHRLMGSQHKIRLKKKVKAHHKQAHYFEVTSAKAIDIMRAIRPYMGQRRGAKIDEIIAYFEGGPERRSGAMYRKWSDPVYRQNTTDKIAAANKAKGAKGSEAVRKAWITRRQR